MRMKNKKESRNVDDRRLNTGNRRRHGMPSMGTIMMLWPFIRPLLRTKLGWAIIGLGTAAYFYGFNPFSLLGMGSNSIAPINKVEDDKRAVFIKKVLGSTEEIWKDILRKKYKVRYIEPVMVLYRGSTQSACGYASAQMGPFYCPVDQKVYIDLGFFTELSNRHNASGDFAQAYVLAHEVGHHIQNMEGTLAKVQRAKQKWGEGSKRANALQVRVELQADCYAGVWANHAHTKFNILEKGDIEEALRAASSIGDDKLQKEATGYVRPDKFTHGTSSQRIEWFKRGLTSGDLKQCDTFK